MSKPSRAERAREVAALRDRGLIPREIAQALGISRSYAAELLADPDGAGVRARKRSYGRPCIDCGGATDGSNGVLEAPVCAACKGAHYATWPREAIVAAICEWAAQHGRQPGADDFRRDKRLGRHLPSVNNVKRVFGTWRAALDAAGFPRPRGGPAPGFAWLTPAQRRECARRYKAGESSVDIAADLGCAPQTALKWARHHGAEIRPNFIEERAA